MAAIIPKKLTNGKELVVIPREEYESLIVLKEIYEFFPTKTQKKILECARSNRAQGKVITLSELRRKLEITN